jgi:excinuclease UvrABC nuclease subunit
MAELETLAFDPADAKAALNQLPTSSAVFALYGAEAHAEPYIGRTPNLRGRLERLLQPSAKHPRRLQLAGRVRQIRWRLTGSEFESLLASFPFWKRFTARRPWNECIWARRPLSASWAAIPTRALP